VKELLENSLDAGARRVRVNVEAGGRKLIQVIDDGCGMLHDDALLAFERHATSKIRNADDLVNISTLGFRGEALPSIASVSRLRLETHAAEEAAGSVVEIAGGKILTVEEAGLPLGTSISVRDLFFNIPARRKFLKAEPTELAHIASLVTHYALAHPEMHWELHSATNAMLIAPPVADHSQRIYQVFGKETLDQLIPLSAILPLIRVGLPQPPPWRRQQQEEDQVQETTPGEVRLHGFVSRPEIQKLNRNSIFIFVNGRLIRDRVVQHALTEAYRNIMPPTVYPVVLLFLEMPFAEVDVNVHPSKTEVRFRQSSFLHDFIRDSVRAALMKARPVPAFMAEIHAAPTAPAALSPSRSQLANPGALGVTDADTAFVLQAPELPAVTQSLQFGNDGIAIEANAAVPVARFGHQTFTNAASAVATATNKSNGCSTILEEEAEAPASLESLASLKPLGQIRESFILAVNSQGLWIIDQHVAHERVLFEKILKQRSANSPERQQMLMPLLVELTPSQMAVFSEISQELNFNGFEVEPFGTRTIAIKTTAAGVAPGDVEHMLHEILEQFEREEQSLNLETIRTSIAASIACHAAIKVNMPLEQNKMEWLLRELAKTDCPMSCPHGRPVVLRYSVRDIQRAFKRI
jgi:DNA mismatch repair protein MutL